MSPMCQPLPDCPQPDTEQHATTVSLAGTWGQPFSPQNPSWSAWVHPRVHWGELQPRSCACSTGQQGWEVDGGSQLPPVPPHCCVLPVSMVENGSLQPLGAAATLECQNHAVTTMGPLWRRWGFGENRAKHLVWLWFPSPFPFSSSKRRKSKG